MAFGSQEIIIIAVIVLLLFGASAIPKLARGLGQARGEFQKAQKEFQAEMTAGEKEAAAEAQIRKTARDLGIDESGMALAEVKAALNEKLA